MEPIVTRIVAESNSSGPHANCTYPSRRAVMGGLGAAVLSLALPRAVADTLLPLTHSQIEQLLKPILMTEDPALWKFAVGVYEHCILGRMQPAEPPLRHPWLVPGGIYVGQWIWDTTFLTDLLAILHLRKLLGVPAALE